MRNIKFYITIIMVIGMILGVNSSSFAGKNYNIDVKNLKRDAENRISRGDTIFELKANVRNNTGKSQTYEIKVTFLSNNDEKIHEATKIATVSPHETKALNTGFWISTSKVRKIDSGYISISKVEEKIDNEEKTYIAKLEKYIDLNLSKLTDSTVELDYSVKLHNNTDKTMIRNVIVRFLDAENNHVRSETMKTIFIAGESKLITDSLVVTANEADRITKGHVSIN